MFAPRRAAIRCQKARNGPALRDATQAASTSTALTAPGRAWS
jgi:hypothetical protein